MCCAQLPHNHVLGEIGVLILVDKNVCEIVAVVLQNVWVVAQQHIGEEQQVVEVHGRRYPAAFGIYPVYFGSPGPSRIRCCTHEFTVGGIVRRRVQCVFSPGDIGEHVAWTVCLVIELQFLDYGFHEAFGIRCVVDCEVAAESEAVGMPPEHTGEDAVECSHP